MFSATLNFKMSLKSTPQPYSPAHILLGKESGYIFVSTHIPWPKKQPQRCTSQIYLYVNKGRGHGNIFERQTLSVNGKNKIK